MPRQSRERRQAFARYNSSREPMVVPHGLSVCLGCRANQEHLLVLAVQTLSGKTRQEKSHHRGGAYHHRHWLSLAEEAEQLRGSWRKLLRSREKVDPRSRMALSSVDQRPLRCNHSG